MTRKASSMTDQGTNKTGFARDDELKRETLDELRANRALRADEEAEAEEILADRPLNEAARTGGAPPGMTPEGVSLRNELARHLDRSVYPARRGALLGSLHRHQAPDTLVERIESLPDDRVYPNVQEVVRDLGFGVEHPRS
jgi:hypothetical protein